MTSGELFVIWEFLKSTPILKYWAFFFLFFKKRHVSLTRLAGTSGGGDRWLNYGPLREHDMVLSNHFGLSSGCSPPQKHELQLSCAPM